MIAELSAQLEREEEAESIELLQDNAEEAKAAEPVGGEGEVRRSEHEKMKKVKIFHYPIPSPLRNKKQNI